MRRDLSPPVQTLLKQIKGFTIIGFFKKALKMSGARDPVIYSSPPIGDDKGYSELSFGWS